MLIWCDCSKEDFQRFNILVVGEVGIGKTTFLQTFFQRFTSQKLDIHSDAQPTQVINELGQFPVESAGDTASYIFHLIDTPGFGDSLNIQHEIDAIKKYILEKHEAWLSLDPLLEENDRLAHDERIHCGMKFNKAKRNLAFQQL